MKPVRFVPAIAAVVVMAGCNSGMTSSTAAPTAHWKNIIGASLEITQAIPGPGGDVKQEYEGERLDNLIGLMNRYDISVAASHGNTAGCTGGRNFDLVSRPQDAGTVEMTYYSCGGKGSGTMGGDVAAFTTALENELPPNGP